MALAVFCLLLVLPVVIGDYACQRKGDNPTLLSQPVCKLGEVLSSIEIGAYGVNTNIAPCASDSTTRYSTYTPGTCQAAGAFNAIKQACINKRHCTILRSSFNATLSCTGTAYMALYGICDSIGGEYYIPPVVGCPPNAVANSSCCITSTACSGGTPKRQHGTCVASCSAGFTEFAASGGKAVCLDSNCSLTSTSDCSRCIQCNNGLQPNPSGICRLPPLMNVSSRSIPDLNSYCNGGLVNATTDAGEKTKVFTVNVTGTSRSQGASLVAATCVNSNQLVSSPLSIGITFYNCTVMDSDNLSTSCLFSVRVVDIEPPQMVCTPNLTLNTVSGQNYATVPASNTTALDNCCSAPRTPTCNTTSTITANPSGGPTSSLFACTAIDTYNNTAQCTYRVTVLDKEAPTFTGALSNTTVNEIPNTGFGTFVWSVPTAVDNVAGPVVVTCNKTGNTFPIGRTLVVCVASDNSNNVGYFQFNVTVIDKTPPVVNCPANSAILSVTTLNNLTWALPTATDNVGVISTKLFYFVQDMCPSSSFCTTTFLSTNDTLNRFFFTAFDGAGQSSTCQFDITAQLDLEPPTISSCTNVYANISDGTTAGYLPCPVVTAVDNSGLPVHITVGQPGTMQPLVCNTIVAMGVYPVTVNASDTLGNSAQCTFNMVVQDVVSPVITLCPSPISVPTVVDLNSTNVTWSILATDNSGAYTISYSPNVVNGQSFVAGTRTITATLSDSSANSATCQFTITVLDNQNPVISGCPSNATHVHVYEVNVTANSNTGSFPVPPFVPKDNVAIKSSVFFGKTGNNLYNIGTTRVTYRVTDMSDNIEDCIFDIRVNDTQPPQINNCPANAIFVGNTTAGLRTGIVSWPLITASDNVPSGLIPNYISDPFGFTRGSPFPLGQTNMTFEVTDAAGNRVACMFYVMVVDNEPPSFSFCPSSFFVFTNTTDSIYGDVTWDTPIATDNVGAGTINSSLAPGSYTLGLYNVSVSVMDERGNLGICNFTFDVLQNQGSTGASGSTSIVGPVAGAAAAGSVVLLLVVVLVILRRIQKRRLATAQAGYAELMAMSDEFILEKARIIQITLMAQKQAVAPSMEAQNTKPQREFEPPPSSHDALIGYITDVLKKSIDRSTLVLGPELGHGEFGSVLEGTHRNPTTHKEAKVAIKQLKLAVSEESKVRFLKEAAIMAQFDHPNIVHLIGVCVQPITEPSLIVLEYMHLGSLQSYLETPLIKNQLEQLTLLRMAIDVAAGMVYLSEASFVHRDLAARNVLIDKEMTCRIGDFGLSIDMASSAEDDTGIYSGSEGVRIPIRWSAPEAVLYRHFSSSSDVWSFGILMWEIWTYAEMPYQNWSNKKVIQMIQGGYRLPLPSGCPSEVYGLIVECWNKNPKHRPPFNRISSVLIETWKDINAMHQNQMYGSRRNSLADNVLENSPNGAIYDNSGQGMDPFDEEDDERGYETNLQETNMNQTKRGIKAKPAVSTMYDVGGDGDDMDYETESPMQPQKSTKPDASQLYDNGGDGELIGPNRPMLNRRPSVDVLATIMGTKDRESLGLSDTLSSQSLGQRVIAQGYGTGVLAFVGPSEHDGEIHCGIELDSPLGSSDGIFNNKRYFTCPQKHGVLVPLWSVVLESEIFNKNMRKSHASIRGHGNDESDDTTPASRKASYVPTTNGIEEENTAEHTIGQVVHILSQSSPTNSPGPSTSGYLDMETD